MVIYFKTSIREYLGQVWRFRNFGIKIKSKNVTAAHAHFTKTPLIDVSALMDAPDDRKHFWLTDPYGNYFNIVEGDDWFKTSQGFCGGVVAAVIGVTNLDKAV